MKWLISFSVQQINSQPPQGSQNLLLKWQGCWAFWAVCVGQREGRGEREWINLQEAANDKRAKSGRGEECKEQTRRIRNQDAGKISGDKKEENKTHTTEKDQKINGTRDDGKTKNWHKTQRHYEQRAKSKTARQWMPYNFLVKSVNSNFKFHMEVP